MKIRSFRHWSIRTKLISVTLLLVSLSLLCVVYLSMNRFGKALRGAAEHDLRHLVKNIYSMCKIQQETVQKKVVSDLNVARRLLYLHGNEINMVSGEKIQFDAINQFTDEIYLVTVPLWKVVAEATATCPGSTRAAAGNGNTAKGGAGMRDDLSALSSRDCVLGWCGEEWPGMAYAIVRRATLKAVYSRTGATRSPTKKDLGEMAVAAAFVQSGLTSEQAWEKYREGRHRLVWESSAFNLIKRESGVLDDSWDVPCAIVFFMP